ncbi:cation efflux system protein [Cohnella abietis]|uniref:Cation efflux system protein n=2 Tax=Cohnella abietis TaxID=2507935 RepID=A0A3T1D8B7_9BACL|nr:cation efflux system protein [Cohnella abietis]
MKLTLPKVTLTTSSRGQLVHTFVGSGVVKWKAEVALTNSTGWKVERVKVKVGDLVKKGQSLVTYDNKAAEQQILDEQASVKKLKLSIEEQQKNFIEASHSGDEKSIDNAKHAMKISAIDLDVQERRVKKLQEDLIANRELIAPFDGIIIKANAIEGLASGGGPDVIISNRELGFEFSFLAPADAVAQLEIGAKMGAQVAGSDARQIEGQVEDIRDVEAGDGTETGANNLMKRITVKLKDEAVKGGERVQVELTKTTDDVILVPNNAIHDEGGKKYVFGIEEKDGPLGNTFYTRKIFITIIDSNESLSAVSEGLFDQESIIIESSEPLQDGDKIRL